jgi:hypothetical protein
MTQSDNPKSLALVYEDPPEQVFTNAASAFGITAEQARKAYGQMICDAQPTIVGDAEPHTLALNSRALRTMLALEGRSQDSAIDTRWFGIRYDPPDRGPSIAATP